MMMHLPCLESGSKVGLVHLTLYAAFAAGNVTNAEHYSHITGGVSTPSRKVLLRSRLLALGKQIIYSLVRK